MRLPPPLQTGLLALFAAACAEPSLEVSGRVEARRVTVSAEMTGRLLALHVDEADAVAAGDLLAEIECDLPLARLEQARAGVREAQARLDLLLAGSRTEEIDAAQARVAAAAAELELARKGAREEEIERLQATAESLDAQIRLAQLNVERARELLKSEVASQARVDEAVAELDRLQAERRRVDAELREARAGARPEEVEVRAQALAEASARSALLRAGARAEEIEAARAALEAARAAETGAAEQVERCRITAPVPGRIEIVDFEAGEIVPLGAPVAAIAREGELRVRTYAPQEVIGSLEPGDELQVTVDGHPDRPAPGRVERIWDEAEFTAGNVQTPGDRMLLVYRVDLLVDPAPEIGLRPGATVLVDFGTLR